jgi:hypothetical protein
VTGKAIVAVIVGLVVFCVVMALVTLALGGAAGTLELAIAAVLGVALAVVAGRSVLRHR